MQHSSPSRISPEDALSYGVEYWKAQSDYWQKKALHEKNRFNRLPFSDLVVFVEAHPRLRGLVFNLLRVIPSPLGDKLAQKSLVTANSHVVFDTHEQQIFEWFKKAKSFESKAAAYTRVNDKIEKSLILRPLIWLWHMAVLSKRRIRPEDILLKMSRPISHRSEYYPDLISVITPTHNRAYCLEHAIDSLLAQSYGNWELIVVDDGSTDDTQELLKKYRDKRITFCRIPKSGVSKARNVGLSMTRGRYIAFLDSDNILHPDFLMEMHKEISRTDRSVGFVYCNCHIYQDGYRLYNFSKTCGTAALFRRPLIDLGTIMCKKEVFEDGELLFNEEMDKWVDHELILRIDARWNNKHLKKTLLHYFRLEDGISLALETQRDMSKNMAVIRKTKRDILKIGYVLWDYPALSQTFVHSEIEWLLNHGIDVKVYYKTAPDKAAILPYEVENFQVNSPKQLVKLAHNHKRNLLHTHFAYPACTLLTWPAAEKGSISFTLVSHGVDIFAYANEKRNKLSKMANSPMCKALFAFGPFVMDYYVRHGVQEEKIVIKPNGIDPSWFEEKFEVTDAPIRKVLFVGRFVEKKGLFDLIAVAKRVTDLDLEFNIYGYGPLEKKIETKASGVPNIKLHIGGLSHMQVKKVLREADLYFLPCVRAKNGDMDGLPHIFLEAAAAMVPVLTSGLSSIPLMVEDGVTGFLCSPGDIDCFEKRLRELAGRSKKDLEPMLTAARNRVVELFHPDVVNNTLIETWVL